MKAKIKSIWLRWTQPHPSLITNADRVRSQALASVLVAMFIIGVLFEVSAILLKATAPEFLATEIPIIALIGLLIIPSKRRYYQIVAIVLSIVITTSCFLLTIMSAYQPSLVFMTLGYLIVATSLPTRWSLFVGVVNILLTLASPIFVEEWHGFGDISIELSYIIAATIVIYALTFIQRYYMNVNDHKSHQLSVANALLREKIQNLEETQAIKTETQANFSKVFDSSPDPIVINRFYDGKYIAYNQSFMDLMGYSDDDLVNMSGKDLFADDDNANRYLQQMMRDKQIFSTEFDVKTKMGQIRTALLSAEFIDWYGERCIVCMARDITIHKQAQQQKLDMMKEQERAVLLQQFITSASHDFRTPLATIGTSIHIIRRIDNAERRDHHLTIIDRQIQRINLLVDNLTMMYMLDSHELEFQFYMSDINELVADIIERQPNPDEIKIKTVLAPNLPPAEIDSYYLTTAIKHILSNALQFTQSDGLITIKTELCIDGKRVCIVINDTGVGMDEETLKNSFNRLYRGDSSRNQDTGGAGLGLSITNKIIEHHHGTIVADSKIGVGSSFMIVIPLNQPKALTVGAD